MFSKIAPPSQQKTSKLALALLWLMIAAFTVYFSWYTIQRYETLNAYTADLSLIDQAMWNTLHGRFLEATWGDHQQPRLAEHFEPILVPLAGLFWLWDDVRILLIAQAFALAMGALPLYWLAQYEFKVRSSAFGVQRSAFSVRRDFTFYVSRFTLLFPFLYLLSPPLQAAAVADFHADPFVAAPFLFAFWYATQKRWGWMWFWAIVVMLVKENMPTLIVMMGLYVVLTSARKPPLNPPQREGDWSVLPPAGGVRGGRGLLEPSRLIGNQPFFLTNLMPLLQREGLTQSGFFSRGGWHGLGLIVVGLLWFAVATFGIVAPLAKEYFASDGPVYLANRFSANPVEWLALLQEPQRLRYLLGLLATTGGLALFAPHYLLLGLPIFIANTFSNFSGQFSGEQHYSAPLVGILMISAVYGTRFLLHRLKQRNVFYALLAVALLIALGYHYLYGWTPLSQRAEVYAHSAHTQSLPALLTRVPADVAVSASAGVHPHLAHRAVAYTFPTVEDAEIIVVDVTDVPGIHPNDVRHQLKGLLDSGDWRLVQAQDGFMLLQREAVATAQNIPAEFYTFAQTEAPNPVYPLDLTFGKMIKLYGFEVIDDPFHQQSSVRLIWESLQSGLPENLTLWIQFYNDYGLPISNPILQPAIETVWYPPAKWQAGEFVTTTTLPQPLGESAHLAVAVIEGDNFERFESRLPVTGAKMPHDHNTWATAATFKREGWPLRVLPPTEPTQKEQDIQFEGGLFLRGVGLPVQPTQAEEALSISLSWEATEPLGVDYTLFLHLVDENGTVVAQVDTQPFWLAPQPAARWETDRPIFTGLTFDSPLPSGEYNLRLGLYDWQTLERLPLLTGGDSVIIGQVTIKE